jgi:hypothetical protein
VWHGETLDGVLDWTVYRFTQRTLPTVNRKHFFMNILCTESFGQQQKNAQQNAALQWYIPQARSPF